MIASYAAIAVLTLLGLALLLAARADRIQSGNKTGNRGEAAGRIRAALDRMASQIGPSVSASELGAIWIGCALLPGLIGLVAGLGAGSLMLNAIGALSVPAYASTRKRRRRRLFEDQLGEVMPLIASNMRAGASVAAAITPVAEAMEEPVRGEFARLAADVKSGTPLAEALDTMAERNTSKDVRLFAIAVRVSQQRGGSLADITERVGETVRARTEMRRFIRAKTSLNRFEAYFLSGMPIFILLILLMMSETHRAFYATPMGWAVLAVCLVLDALGLSIMFKMGELETD